MAEHADQITSAQAGRQAVSPDGQERLSLDRRFVLKGMVSAVPAVLTVRSGAALAASTFVECANDGATGGNAVLLQSTPPTTLASRPVATRHYTRTVMVGSTNVAEEVWTYLDLDDNTWRFVQGYDLYNGAGYDTYSAGAVPPSSLKLDDPTVWSRTEYDRASPRAYAVVYVNDSSDELQINQITTSSGYPVDNTRLQLSAACSSSLAALGLDVGD